MHRGVFVQLKDLSHDNVTMFIGACNEPGHVCYVLQFCTRGTVQANMSHILLVALSAIIIIISVYLSS